MCSGGPHSISLITVDDLGRGGGGSIPPFACVSIRTVHNKKWVFAGRWNVGVRSAGAPSADFVIDPPVSFTEDIKVLFNPF